MTYVEIHRIEIKCEGVDSIELAQWGNNTTSKEYFCIFVTLPPHLKDQM